MIFHTLSEVLHQWPWPTASFAVVVPVATAIGFAIAYLVSRGYIKQTIATLKETIETQEKNLQTKDQLAISLAATHSELILTCDHKLDVMTKERDAYRTDSHATREPMQAMQLKIQEYELRPDLNRVLEQEEQWHQRRETFYLAMAENQKSILETQRVTIELINKNQEDLALQIGGNFKALKDVMEKLEKRDGELTSLLGEILKQLARNADRNEEAQKQTRPVVVTNDADNRVPVAPPNPTNVVEVKS